jgi:hypothetical protein
MGDLIMSNKRAEYQREHASHMERLALIAKDMAKIRMTTRNMVELNRLETERDFIWSTLVDLEMHQIPIVVKRG